MKRPTNAQKYLLLKRTWEQYQKLLQRLQRSFQSGRFQQLSKARQTALIATLKRYYKRLLKNDSPVRKLAIGATLLLSLMSTSQSQGQAYIQPGGTGNSLGEVNVGSLSFPVFVDIDNDSDLDVFIGAGDGSLTFYRNDGTSNAPNYVEITGAANPLDGVSAGANAAPFFADIDGNGTQDLFLGNFNGQIIYYQNTGTVSTPNFILQTGVNNPFDGIDVGNLSAPNLVDIDNDGDLDAFITENNLEINFFLNTGNSTTPTFVQQTGANNPLDGAPIGTNAAITFVDFDNDNDFDAFIGSTLGMVQYYVNSGTNTTPIFNIVTGTANPFNGIDVGNSSNLIPNPCFVDINNDGNLDVFIGNLDGTINYFQCEPNFSCQNFDFFKVPANENPLNGQDIGFESAPNAFDIDNDGDLDILAGNEDGEISFFQNTGTPNAPIFTPITGANNPFDGVDVGDNAAPEFVDLDGDNITDVVIGESSGTLNFFKNIGTVNAPIYQQIIGTTNPLNGITVEAESHPSFVDIDLDGDVDLFVGDDDGRILFFRNDGNTASPSFTQINNTDNPFFGIDLENEFSPDFVDIDNDGDLDAIIGNKAGSPFFFRNDGTATNPKFVGLYGDCNPFTGLLPVVAPSTINENSTPILVDIDNDGQLEVIVGQLNGTFCILDQNVQQLVAQRTQIPTMSQWGKMIFGLLILNLGLILIKRLTQMKKALI